MVKRPVTVTSSDNQNQSSPKALKSTLIYIAGAALIALIGYFGWNYLQKTGLNVDTVAADKYAAIEQNNMMLRQRIDAGETIADTDLEALDKDIDALVAEHGESVYAWQALMIKARNASDNNDFDGALAALEQALAIDLNDAGLTAINQLRYAEILVEQGDLKAAKSAAGVDVPLAFEPSQQELLGDIYLAEGDEAGAISAYENAWSMLEKRQEERPILRLKLQDLGVSPTPIAPPAQIVAQADATPQLEQQNTADGTVNASSAENEVTVTAEDIDVQTTDGQTTDTQALVEGVQQAIEDAVADAETQSTQ